MEDQPETPAPAPELELELTSHDVPDALFASDNEFDIPLLDLNMQANYLDLPLRVWGSTRRRIQMHGTWNFYTDDYRFTSLWSDPTPVINSGCVACVEPNFSVNNQQPTAVAIYRIYQKRWLARYFQTNGIRIWVDMHTGPRHAQINLLGVPREWKSYMSKADENFDWLDCDYQTAVAHSGEDINFVVYGGSEPAHEMCKERGWIWCPGLMDTKIRGAV